MSEPTLLKGKFPNGLAAALAASGIGQSDLARRIDTSRQNIKRWKDQEQKLPLPMAQKIAPVLGTTAEALMVPRPMLEEPRRVPLGQEFDPDPEFEHDENAAAAGRSHKRTLEPGEVPERNVIAGLGQGGTADGVVVDGQVLDGVRAVWRLPPDFLRTELRSREGDVDFIAVDGDSMIPTLLPGDRVMINRSQTAPSPDGLYAIFDGIGISVKRLEIVKGSNPIRIRIKSDNPNHSTDEILATDLHVIGRVVCRVTRC